jgi:hypothetical protein
VRVKWQDEPLHVWEIMPHTLETRL